MASGSCVPGPMPTRPPVRADADSASQSLPRRNARTILETFVTQSRDAHSDRHPTELNRVDACPLSTEAPLAALRASVACFTVQLARAPLALTAADRRRGTQASGLCAPGYRRNARRRRVAEAGGHECGRLAAMKRIAFFGSAGRDHAASLVAELEATARPAPWHAARRQRAVRWTSRRTGGGHG